jgi:ligand-binding SRPBCC domain-containing protein
MPLVELKTLIHAAPEVCFDMSLDIDLHMESMKETNERAVGGRTSGRINLGETVTWSARHFGLYFTMTSRITELSRPLHFTDEMIKGPFKYLRHQHLFEKAPEGTMMTDLFEFQSPLGFVGRVAEKAFLETYLRNLLVKRNSQIKTAAERNKDLEL